MLSIRSRPNLSSGCCLSKLSKLNPCRPGQDWTSLNRRRNQIQAYAMPENRTRFPDNPPTIYGLELFLDSAVEIIPAGEVLQKDLYFAYQESCKANGVPAMNAQVFGSRLKMYYRLKYNLEIARYSAQAGRVLLGIHLH